MDKEKHTRYLQAYFNETENFIVSLLLSGKIRLADIPLYVRANNGIYVAALRVSRNFYNWFTEDLKILMFDIEKLPIDYCGNYKGNIRNNFIRLLKDNVEMYNEFRGISEFENFRKEFYEPFLQKLCGA